MSTRSWIFRNPRHRKKNSIFAAFAFVLTLLLAGSVLPLTQPQPAYAVADGAGRHFGSLFVGNYYTTRDNTLVYCIELNRLPLYDMEHEPQNVTTLPGFVSQSVGVDHEPMSGEPIRHINYLIAQHGATKNDDKAVSVALAIWKIRAGENEAIVMKRFEDLIRADGRADLIHAADRLVTEARNFNYDTQHERPDSPVIQMSDAYHGTVKVSKNTQRVTLNNAVFADTGERSRSFGAGLRQDTSFTIVGQPPLGDGNANPLREYTVSITGSYRYPVTSKTATVYFADKDLQSTMSAPRVKYEWRTASFDASTTVDTVWKPELRTETPVKKVPKGSPFSDTVSFDVAADSNPWHHGYSTTGDKHFTAITATGTLYGPFLSDPALNPSPEPPKGAPVAATATVTTNPKQGAQTVAVETDEVSRETGYYTWQWVIENQPEHAALPSNYRYADGFGVASEGQFTDMELRISTQLSHTEIALADTLTDTVSVELASHGGWLQGDDGKRIPVTLTGTLYHSEEPPEQQATVPSDATPVHRFEPLVVTGPDEVQVSNGYQIPADASGYLTVVWCVEEYAQPEALRGFVKAGCDDYGVPEETVKILRPEVTTQATPETAVFGSAHDTALIEGTLPKTATRVTFEAFLRPETGAVRFNENWEMMRDPSGEPVTWHADEIGECEAQPVAKTEAVAVTGVGSVKSPEITVKSVGTLYWVETLESLFTLPDGEHTWLPIHRGQCGLANETTFILPPTVTTVAKPHAVVGDEIWDVAEVAGDLAAAEDARWELSFAAYQNPGEALSDSAEYTSEEFELCNADTLLWESPQPHPVTQTGEIQSDSFAVDDSTRGEVLWVETLTLIQHGEVTYTASGLCGERSEITTVSQEEPPPAPKSVEPQKTAKAPEAELAATGSAETNWFGPITVLVIAVTLMMIGGARTRNSG